MDDDHATTATQKNGCGPSLPPTRTGAPAARSSTTSSRPPRRGQSRRARHSGAEGKAHGPVDAHPRPRRLSRRCKRSAWKNRASMNDIARRMKRGLGKTSLRASSNMSIFDAVSMDFLDDTHTSIFDAKASMASTRALSSWSRGTTTRSATPQSGRSGLPQYSVDNK